MARIVRRAAALALLASLGWTSAASAAPASYMLKRPAREHCRALFVRRVRRIRGHREVWCIRPKPDLRTRTVTTVTVTNLEGSGPRVSHVIITTSVRASGGSSNGLQGVPVTLTIEEAEGGGALASFAVSAGPDGVACSISEREKEVPRTEGFTLEYEGQATGPYEACPVGPFHTMWFPGHEIKVLASFAGNRQYAPSTAEAVESSS